MKKNVYLFWASFVLLLGYCMSQAVEMPCFNTPDCTTLIKFTGNVSCVDGLCKCSDPTDGTWTNCNILSSTSQKVEVGVIGHVCSIDENCSQQDPNAKCNTTIKQCTCKNGYVASEDKLSCIKALGYNESGCTADKYCALTPNAICLHHTCKCPSTHWYTATSRCVERISWGLRCVETENCNHVSNAICDDSHQCSCPTNMVINSNTQACLPKASKIQDPCEESIQCTDLLGLNAVCKDKRCLCVDHHHHSTIENKCLANKKFNETCEADHDCLHGHENIVEEMKCSLDSSGARKACLCSSDYHYDNSTMKCVMGSEKSGAKRITDLAIFTIATVLLVFLSSII